MHGLVVVVSGFSRTSIFSEPLYFEVLGITKDIHALPQVKYMIKNLDITKPRHHGHTLLVPRSFAVSTILDKKC